MCPTCARATTCDTISAMKSSLGFVVALVAVAGCASSPKPAGAQKRAYPAAGSPPAGGQEALAMIREIEAEPFREDEPFKVKQARVLSWAIQAPDLTVILCSDLM